jgi:hypothetical protein
LILNTSNTHSSQKYQMSDKEDVCGDDDDDGGGGTTTTTGHVMIWDLPEVLLYHIACFVAPRTKRAHVLCHDIAPLCRAASRAILDDERSVHLWHLVLQGDYGSSNTTTYDSSTMLGGGARPPKRCCQRLRRSPVHRVRDAQALLQKNTEIAYFFLWELSYENSSIKKGSSLTRKKLCGILAEYGPLLLVNEIMSSGGTFLVEVCRSRNTSQRVILECVKELVEARGAMVNLATNESANSTLTALCVAAVRGMPKVVQYLLSKGASRDIQCSGRFRLYKNPKKSVKCTQASPLEFATAMLAEEKKEGATTAELSNLKNCIKLLLLG